MNLEPVTQSEVKSEREKQIPYINAHLWSLQMFLMHLFAGQDRDTDTENRLADTAGEGEGRTN